MAPKRAAVSSRRSLRVEAKRNEVSVSYAKALVELADEKSKLEPVHAGTFSFVRLLFVGADQPAYHLKSSIQHCVAISGSCTRHFKLDLAGILLTEGDHQLPG